MDRSIRREHANVVRPPMTERSYPLSPGSHRINPIPLDSVLTLLGDVHRRRIVTALVDEDARTVEDFVTSAEEVDPRTLEIALVHKHLPNLRDAGVIEWQMDTGIVRRGPQFDAVETVVGLLRSNQDALPADWP